VTKSGAFEDIAKANFGNEHLAQRSMRSFPVQ
jgi:hypothetical protein